jgi:hypothetical protein
MGVYSEQCVVKSYKVDYSQLFSYSPYQPPHIHQTTPQHAPTPINEGEEYDDDDQTYMLSSHSLNSASVDDSMGPPPTHMFKRRLTAAQQVCVCVCVCVIYLSVYPPTHNCHVMYTHTHTDMYYIHTHTQVATETKRIRASSTGLKLPRKPTFFRYTHIATVLRISTHTHTHILIYMFIPIHTHTHTHTHSSGPLTLASRCWGIATGLIRRVSV